MSDKMIDDLRSIRDLLEQAEPSMQIAVDHFGKDALFGNAFQHSCAKQRKQAFRGALRKIYKMIDKEIKATTPTAGEA